jgi:hypothetical protein
VVINKLVVPSTIDERVIAALAKKDESQEGLMQAVKSLVKKHKANFDAD